MIDPSQVKEAIRLTSNPPSQVNQEQEIPRSFPRNGSSLHLDRKQDDTPDIVENEKRMDLKSTIEGTRDLEKDVRVTDDPPDQSVARQNSIFRRFIPDISVTSSPSPGKGKDQELNDEGFEETQSLVSETLSQETSSGNYETDTHDSTRYSPAELSYGGEQRRRSITAVDDDDLDSGRRSSVNKLVKPSANKTFDKTRETASVRNASEKSSFLPKRTASTKRESALRKTESLKRPANVTSSNSAFRSEVQRSGSRSSLRSSRSSLNSATSVNTVRNLAAGHAHLRSYTSAIRALTNDLRKNSPSNSPLPPKKADKRRPSPRQQISVSRIPASRSSSSGSSVGPAARSLRKAQEVGT